MRIRVATKADLEGIVALAIRSKKTTASKVEDFEADAKKSIKSFNVLEDANGSIIGYSKVHAHSKDKATIESIAIKHNLVGRNFEHKLFDQIKAKYSTIEYNGKYAKALGFNKGVYIRQISNTAFTLNESLKTRTEELDGIKYLVAPVIMVKEQVLNGEYLPAEEIQKSTPGWNGRPVVVYHPKDTNDNDTSANDPDIVENYEIGKLYNVEYDAETTKLKGEIWVDISKARKNKNTRQAYNMIKKSEELEVSTGYFVNDRLVENGEFDGEEYTAIQREILPDHLALLPNEIGACSWEDGAGVRNNSARSKHNQPGIIGNILNPVINALQGLLAGNVDHEQIPINQALSTALREIHGDAFDWMQDTIVDTTDNLTYAIFTLRNYDDEGNIVYPGETMKQAYTIGTDGLVSLGETAVAVEPVMQYIIKNEQKEENTLNMNNLVQAVITNSKGKFGRRDKATLMNMSEATLLAMLPATAKNALTANSKTTTKHKPAGNSLARLKANDMVEMTPEELVAEVQTIIDGAATPEEAITELNAVADELDQDIMDLEDVLTTVEDKINALGGVTEEEAGTSDAAANMDTSDVTDPNPEEEEDATASALASASSRRSRRNRRNKVAAAAKTPAANQSIDAYIANIPDASAREFIQNGVNQAKQRRNQLLKEIAANKTAGFTANELSKMETNQLEKIYKMLSNAGPKPAPAANYGIRGIQANNDQLFDETPGYIPLSVNIFKKEGK